MVRMMTRSSAHEPRGFLARDPYGITPRNLRPRPCQNRSNDQSVEEAVDVAGLKRLTAATALWEIRMVEEEAEDRAGPGYYSVPASVHGSGSLLGTRLLGVPGCCSRLELLKDTRDLVIRGQPFGGNMSIPSQERRVRIVGRRKVIVNVAVGLRVAHGRDRQQSAYGCIG
jgi:hypothetical protein